MVRLTLKLADRGEWVKVFDPRDCTIFVASGSPPGVGAKVRIDLEIGREGPRVILHGQVISQHQKPDGSLPSGCNVAIGHQDREKINYLNGFVRGGLLNLRELRRLPLRLPVSYSGPDGPHQSHTRDINERGVFVVTETPLAERTLVQIRLSVPDVAEPVALVGVVSHTVVVEDEDVPGMGILFRFAEGSDARFRAIIDRLEERFMTGDLPDDVLM